METIFQPQAGITFSDHPKFAGVQIAILVSGKDTGAVSVSRLEIAPATEIPIHTHNPQVDSILVLAGQGEVYCQGQWQRVVAGDYLFVPATVEHGVRNTGPECLQLFVHHSPPLL